MKVLTIKQPWAYLIAAGIKDIENRTWKCPKKYIGERALIHASASAPKSIRELLNADQIDTVFKSDLYNNTDFAKQYSTGAIIGSIEIVDCVVNHSSIWAEKQRCIHHSPGKDLTKIPNCWDGCIYFPKPIYNWILANPILFPEPIHNVKGKLGFWNYEE